MESHHHHHHHHSAPSPGVPIPGGAAPEVRLVERDSLPVPPNARKVRTHRGRGSGGCGLRCRRRALKRGAFAIVGTKMLQTGTVANFLVADAAAGEEKGPGEAPGEAGRTLSVLDGETVGFDHRADSHLLVPLQVAAPRPALRGLIWFELVDCNRCCARGH